MNEQNQPENIEETGNIVKEEQKDEEEDTIEQVNKQVLDDKEKNEEEQEENINIVKEDIKNNVTNNKEIAIEIKDNNAENPLNNVQKNINYRNLTIHTNNNFYIGTNNSNNNNQNIKDTNDTNNNNNNYISKTCNNQNQNTKPNNNYYLNKFENYNDELKRYYFNKKYSNFHINVEENFLERMQFDIYKRQIKEERLNDLVEQNKVKIEEEKRIKTFNHLIEDANRRLKAQINMDELKNQLNEDLISSSNFYKKYNDDEWNEIYKKRFKAYQENINKKKEENKKFYEEEKKKKEQEIINLCPNKKAPIKHIIEASQKMYDEAKKRKIKKKEKVEKSYNKKDTSNNVKKTNKKNDNETEDKTTEGNDYKTNILNQFLMNNINNDKKQRNNKTKSTDKIIINKNKRKIIPLRNKRNNKHNDYTPNKYFINHKLKNYINKNNAELLEKNININDINNNNYNLEEERKILIQMAERKRLYHIPSVNNISPIEKKLKNSNYNTNNDYIQKNNKNNNPNISESDKIIEEFFIRHFEL